MGEILGKEEMENLSKRKGKVAVSIEGLTTHCFTFILICSLTTPLTATGTPAKGKSSHMNGMVLGQHLTSIFLKYEPI